MQHFIFGCVIIERERFRWIWVFLLFKITDTQFSFVYSFVPERTCVTGLTADHRRVFVLINYLVWHVTIALDYLWITYQSRIINTAWNAHSETNHFSCLMKCIHKYGLGLVWGRVDSSSAFQLFTLFTTSSSGDSWRTMCPTQFAILSVQNLKARINAEIASVPSGNC